MANACVLAERRLRAPFFTARRRGCGGVLIFTPGKLLRWLLSSFQKNVRVVHTEVAEVSWQHRTIVWYKIKATLTYTISVSQSNYFKLYTTRAIRGVLKVFDISLFNFSFLIGFPDLLKPQSRLGVPCIEPMRLSPQASGEEKVTWAFLCLVTCVIFLHARCI